METILIKRKTGFPDWLATYKYSTSISNGKLKYKDTIELDVNEHKYIEFSYLYFKSNRIYLNQIEGNITVSSQLNKKWFKISSLAVIFSGLFMFNTWLIKNPYFIRLMDFVYYGLMFILIYYSTIGSKGYLTYEIDKY